MRRRLFVVAALALLVLLVAAPAFGYEGIVNKSMCGLGTCHSYAGYDTFAEWHTSHQTGDIALECQYCHPNNHTVPGAPSAPAATYSLREACMSCHPSLAIAPVHTAASVSECDTCHYPQGSLTGYVRTASGTGVEGVSITVGALSPYETYAGGQYIAAKIPVGTYSVTYAKAGFTSQTISGVAITNGGTVTRDVVLVPVAGTDSTPPVTTSNATSTYTGSATIALAAVDNLGGSGVAHTYYILDGGPQTAGTSVSAGTGYHRLEYWSVDAADNSEAHHVVYFTVNAAPSTTTTVYRFYNTRLGVHFYTANESERDAVLATLGNVYTYEGPAYTLTPSANTQPLHRFYNRRVGVHFYTASEAERARVTAELSDTYAYEGVAYNVSTSGAAGAVSVHRFYNTRTGTHFYTADDAERQRVIATLSGVYTYEGVAFYLGQ